MQGRILFLEDDRLFAETILDFLEDDGHEVEHFYKAADAIEATYKSRYDLYLLDVNLPDMSGFEFLKELRESGDETFAMFITSARQKCALLQGFECGADDYIKKPVDLDELSRRIEVQLRRAKGRRKIQVKEYLFDMDRLALYRKGEPVALPRRVAEILSILLRNRGEVVGTEEILSEIYGSDNPGTGALRVYINKLKQLFGKDSIVNIRGVGYCFEA